MFHFNASSSLIDISYTTRRRFSLPPLPLLTKQAYNDKSETKILKRNRIQNHPKMRRTRAITSQLNEQIFSVRLCERIFISQKVDSTERKYRNFHHCHHHKQHRHQQQQQLQQQPMCTCVRFCSKQIQISVSFAFHFVYLGLFFFGSHFQVSSNWQNKFVLFSVFFLVAFFAQWKNEETAQ